MARRRKGLHLSGWINLDKPLGQSSTQALGKARWLLNARKAGHGGTLDPLATGVLPLAFGEATKLLPYVVDDTKGYEFDISWGTSTTTDDREGDVVDTSDHRPAKSDIAAALPDFIGTISQRPPAYSAIKVDGARAYDLARAGETVELKHRDVRIDTLDLLDAGPDFASVAVTCGKGTYVRSLARDLAIRLGTVGHVSRLVRTRVGSFRLEDAITLEKIEALDDKPQLLLPVETVLDDIPALALTSDQARRIRHGQSIGNCGLADGEALLTFEGQPVAIAIATPAELKPARVFNLTMAD